MDVPQHNQPRSSQPPPTFLTKASRIILLLYIFVMPFVSAFSFTATISLPLICAVFLFGIMLLEVLSTGRFPPGFIGYDLLVIGLFIFNCGLSFIYNGWGNSKSLNHTIAYISTFFLFYIAIKYILFKQGDKAGFIKSILKLITIVTTINALYVNAEFVLANIADLNLNDYIPRPSDDEMKYSASVIELFTRARGFANESGVYAQMIELFLPLAVYYLFYSGYCKWYKLIRILIIVLVVTSILFAASSASFVVLPAAYLIAFVFYAQKAWDYFRKRTIMFYLGFFMTAAIIFVLNFYLSVYALIALSITDKMDSGSFDDRQSRIDFFYQQFDKFDFIKKIIGAAPAGSNILGFDETKSIISLYYSVAFELGLAGLSLLLFIILYIGFRIARIKDKIGFFLLSSFLAGALHYYVLHNYWVPWFWFVAVFSLMCYRKQQDELKS